MCDSDTDYRKLLPTDDHPPPPRLRKRQSRVPVGDQHRGSLLRVGRKGRKGERVKDGSLFQGMGCILWDPDKVSPSRPPMQSCMFPTNLYDKPA